MDQPVGTRGLASSIVSPILDDNGLLGGVLAFYSTVLDSFSLEHQSASEAIARLLSTTIRQDNGGLAQEARPLDLVEQLIS